MLRDGRAMASCRRGSTGTIGLGGKEQQGKDVLGRVYEYFLSEFALAEGKKGGQFYTPRSVVRVLVAMLAPYKGRVYDPCCGSGGMFVQSERFVEEHGGRIGAISVYGQESNETTWKLARMNLAIRGIEANLGTEHADTFHRDQHPDLKADYVLANPPFNDSDWGQDRLTTHGVATRAPPRTPMCRGSARAPRSMRCERTSTCSRRAATSGPRTSSMMASRSRSGSRSWWRSWKRRSSELTRPPTRSSLH